MAKATPKPRDSMTGEDRKNKTEQLLKRKQYRLKNKALQKMGGNSKIQRKFIQYETPVLAVSDREHSIQRSQWEYEETAKDTKNPPNIQVFPSTQESERLYTKETGQEEFYVIGTKYLDIFPPNNKTNK